MLGAAAIFSINLAGINAIRGFEKMVKEISGDANLRIAFASPEGFDEKIIGDLKATESIQLELPPAFQSSPL